MNPLMIGDIKEKVTSSPQAPSFPQLKSTATGFPEHKKRTRISAFKQKRQGQPAQGLKPQSPNAIPSKPSPTSEDPNAAPRRNGGVGPVQQKSQEDVKSSIDQENTQRLASMSPEEIEAARQELFNGMDSSLLQRLLKRANLDEQNGPSPFMDDKPAEKPASRGEDVDLAPSPTTTGIQNQEGIVPNKEEGLKAPKKKVTFETPYVEDEEDGAAPPPSIQQDQPVPDLDPSDPNFLESLHAKYFPNLPADPSKLAWMAPIPTTNSPADFDSPYHPRQSSLPISQLRFDFRGTLLPPRIARAVPVSKGLHHHGEAPEAAGYTVSELGRLTRSAVPGQRCIAYQTLGRILFRLGRGEFGSDDVAEGIWATVQENRVMESIREEANVDPADFAAGNMVGDGRGRGHRSAYAFAVEAMWLFEKGGWRERLRRGK
ncbi:RNA polymerase II-associated protein RBA50 [Apiospora kogelbergensis]|uniref:RNA polymerase II-associated protein RBA50 n=1 Tax=Apiospora kogelbergensis TaxID=1337665 RepID=A0AAW0QCA5_9PEZI